MTLISSNSPLAPSPLDLKIADIIEEVVDNEVSLSEREIALHNARILFKEMGLDFEDRVDFSGETELNFEQEIDQQKENEIDKKNDDQEETQLVYSKKTDKKPLEQADFIDNQFREILPTLHQEKFGAKKLVDEPSSQNEEHIQEQAKIIGENLDAKFAQLEHAEKAEKEPNIKQDTNFQEKTKKVSFDKIKAVAKEAAKIKIKLPENYLQLDEKSKTEVFFAGYFQKTVSELQPISKGGIDVARHFYNQDVKENPAKYKGSYTIAGKVGKFIDHVKSKQNKEGFVVANEKDLAIVGKDLSMQEKFIFGAVAMAAIATAVNSQQTAKMNQSKQNPQNVQANAMPTSGMLDQSFQNKVIAGKKEKKDETTGYQADKKKYEEMRKAQQAQQEAQLAQQQAQQQAYAAQKSSGEKGGILSISTGKVAGWISGGVIAAACLGSGSDNTEEIEKNIDPEGVMNSIKDATGFLIDKIHHFPLDQITNLFC